MSWENPFMTLYISDQLWNPKYFFEYGIDPLWFHLTVSVLCGLACALFVFNWEKDRNKYYFSYSALSFLYGMISIQGFFIYYFAIEGIHSVMDAFAEYRKS